MRQTLVGGISLVIKKYVKSLKWAWYNNFLDVILIKLGGKLYNLFLLGIQIWWLKLEVSGSYFVHLTPSSGGF